MEVRDMITKLQIDVNLGALAQSGIKAPYIIRCPAAYVTELIDALGDDYEAYNSVMRYCMSFRHQGKIVGKYMWHKIPCYVMSMEKEYLLIDGQ
jgi:hypothetical protein